MALRFEPTYDLSNMSHHPLPLDQGSRPYCKICLRHQLKSKDFCIDVGRYTIDTATIKFNHICSIRYIKRIDYQQTMGEKSNCVRFCFYTIFFTYPAIFRIFRKFISDCSAWEASPFSQLATYLPAYLFKSIERD